MRWVLVLGLVGCSNDGIPELSISGSAGVPEVSWSGRNLEVLNFDRNDALWFSVQPAGITTECTNPLEGRPGFTWGDWPAGYETVDVANQTPVEVPATLEDGDYSMGAAECVNASEMGVSYQQDTFIRFTVENGDVFERE